MSFVLRNLEMNYDVLKGRENDTLKLKMCAVYRPNAVIILALENFSVLGRVYVRKINLSLAVILL